jgi:hypothetical protein
MHIDTIIKFLEALAQDPHVEDVVKEIIDDALEQLKVVRSAKPVAG